MYEDNNEDEVTRTKCDYKGVDEMTQTDSHLEADESRSNHTMSSTEQPHSVLTIGHRHDHQYQILDLKVTGVWSPFVRHRTLGVRLESGRSKPRPRLTVIHCDGSTCQRRHVRRTGWISVVADCSRVDIIHQRRPRTISQ